MKNPGRKLYQRIADTIATEIERGRYAPGMRLPSERELADEQGVSRPTVREAMIALEIRGMVEARHGAGIFVTHAPHRAEDRAELDVGAFELVEARLLFEGEAAALSATTIGAEALAALDTALTEMAAADPRSDAALAADRRFHLLIAEATGNSLVHAAVETLWDVRERSPLCVHMFAQARREGINPRADEHRLIVDALRSGDPTRARATMHDHLHRVTEDLLAATELALVERARSEAEAQRTRIVRRGVR